MKVIIFGLSIFIMIGCSQLKHKQNSIELITENGKQDSIFQSLIRVINNNISESIQQDSLAFLVLPVQASCPSCRKKAIDGIVKHQTDLKERCFIVISATGGRKTISSFFRELDTELPVIENQLFLDSTNQAYKYGLYTNKPTIYYTYKRKAYKKVAAIPATVREDLREFFSGYRSEAQR